MSLLIVKPRLTFASLTFSYLLRMNFSNQLCQRHLSQCWFLTWICSVSKWATIFQNNLIRDWSVLYSNTLNLYKTNSRNVSRLYYCTGIILKHFCSIGIHCKFLIASVHPLLMLCSLCTGLNLNLLNVFSLLMLFKNQMITVLYAFC